MGGKDLEAFRDGEDASTASVNETPAIAFVQVPGQSSPLHSVGDSPLDWARNFGGEETVS